MTEQLNEQITNLPLIKQAELIRADDDLDKQSILRSVHTFAEPLYQRGRKLSGMLSQPMQVLMQHAQDGGPIANNLLDLRLSVEKLNPMAIDFEGGWFTRLLGQIPGVGTPLKRYMIRFESTKTTIDSIVRAIELGRDQIERDNQILEDDQKSIAVFINELQQQIEEIQAQEKGIEELILGLQEADSQNSLQPNKAKIHFLQTELLFGIRQRIVDLQQQLAVQRQALVACGLIVKNNHELIRGIGRALNVTVSALETATTIALALANQKSVISKVKQINDVTSLLIEQTSEQLKTQGAEIHKQAASTMLDTESLKRAFVNLTQAVNDVDSYRIQALPQLKQAINEIEVLNQQN